MTNIIWRVRELNANVWSGCGEKGVEASELGILKLEVTEKKRKNGKNSGKKTRLTTATNFSILKGEKLHLKCEIEGKVN